MHSHDRTLLANLGFADKDKLNPLHELACRYLMENSLSVAKIIKPWELSVQENEISASAKTEHAISKGSGQYKTTIGFIDVVIKTHIYAICIEVKASSIPLSDCIRQIKLYKEYVNLLSPCSWVLATTFKLSSQDIEYLSGEYIKHLYLGEKFQKFVIDSQANQKIDDSNNIEI